MAPSFASTSTHVDSAPAPEQPAQDSAATPAPNKKKPPRATALADAKNVLRAAKAVTSKSLAAPSARCSFSGAGPQFIHQPPDLARHRRKCAICHHPEREIIEDLFIHWHSPEAIASHYEDGDSITWVSIYRHAYAFGLDAIRRRNLRFVFEHILDQAGEIAATPASIIAAARALAACVDSGGHWNDPPKRVIVTNIIRDEQPDDDASPVFVGADRLHRPASSERDGQTVAFSQETESDNEHSSLRASPASVGGAFHPPCPERVAEGRDVITAPPNSAEPVAGTVPSEPNSRVSPKIRNSRNSLKSNESLVPNR